MKKQRYRIHFSKLEPMRFTGHLDLIQTWERICRRSGVPLAYSEGYSPRPLLNMAAPLALGFISIGEIGDIWLSEEVLKSELDKMLQSALPPGISVQETYEVEDLFGPKLPSLVFASSYSLSIPEQSLDLPNRIESLLNSSEIILERRGKEFDLRKLIEVLEWKTGDDQTVEQINTTLVTLPGATGRPDDVLLALGLNPSACLICRTKIHLQSEEG
jgi:radical SAM-linked protein